MAQPTQPTPDPTGTPTAYSYVRFSSPAQADGDSIRRQNELRDQWVKRAGVLLDTSLTLRDDGVSAYTGAHRVNPDRNALAAFLELVRRGRIPRGSFLVVEALDRLSREHIRPALTLLLNLIESGIRIVQLLPAEAIYDENVEPMSLMMAIMELSRGHSESRMKSERLSRAWQEKKRKAATDGVPLGGALPAWVRLEGNRLALIPDRADAVRRIFALATGGYGLGAITKKLNSENVPPIARAKHWARSYVNKILVSRATIGEYQPHKGRAGPNRKPDGPPVPNYFPAVVSEDVWHAAQAALQSRKLNGGRPSRVVGIFSGLLKDARDGGPMHVVNKGMKERAGAKRDKPMKRGTRTGGGPAIVSYRAAQGVAGAVYVSFPRDTFEAAVLSRLREINPREVMPTDSPAADRVDVLEGKLSRLEARRDEIQAELIQGGDLAPLVTVLRVVEGEAKATADELAIARREAASPLAVAWSECRSLLDAINSAPDQEEARTRLRGAVRRLVSDVLCLFVDRGGVRLAAVQFRFVGGTADRVCLIYHRRGHGNGNTKHSRPPTWGVLSAAIPPEAGAFDLAEARDVAALDSFLNKLDVSTLA